MVKNNSNKRDPRLLRIYVAVCGELPTACDYLLSLGVVNIDKYTDAVNLRQDKYDLILVYAPQGEGLMNTWVTVGNVNEGNERLIPLIVPGTDHAMYDSVMGTIPAYAEALYLLADGNDQSPYCGTIDLILPDATEIVDHAFDNAFALKSITLPKVTTVGDGAFYGCTYLRTMTFGSVVTTIIQNERVVFYYVGEEVGGCDLVLNCGQMNSTYIPDLTANTWYDDNNKYFKSITLTHTGKCDECNAAQ